MNFNKNVGLLLGGLLWSAVQLSAPLAHAEFKVALVLDKGGRDDKSFNSAAYNGATQAKDEFKLLLKYVEAGDDNAYEALLRSFAQKNFDLIISIGVAQAEAVKKAAEKFPQKHFAIVDATVDLPNVRSLLFEEHEGSYLVGAAAALVSKSNIIGYIGGMDIPLIRRFEMGYAAGAKKINPKIKVISNFIGVTSDSWNNPAKAKELALTQFNGGADVVFAAAGASNAGLMDAAEETRKYAIGVDSNQNWIKPGRVLTSMLKRVDTAVYAACKDAFNNKFTGGVVRFGLQNKGVDYAVDQHNEKLLTPEIRKKLDQLKIEIISRKIKVPDYYTKK
ncbi:MAG: BMP family ABC transporter substrate-binding protein [Bdellovibrionales bacterium GWA1_52_35]|nr:MAG: BMP family ABC transporter substrate-binding protein [Bdellovibrionales bacterium GWA1_52_35]HCM39955.1 BMP family ABC transporter substrate-binding protein [Bdellovibrionales bacterium]